MTYRTAGSRSVEEVSASLAGARARAAQAREGTREDLERRGRADRADGAAPRPAGTRSELSAPVLAEGEGASGTEPGASAEPDAPPAPPVDEAPAPVHSEHEAAPTASPAAADASASEQASAPPAEPERPADPPAPVPDPAASEGVYQAATPSPQRRTNAEKRAAVLELLRTDPDASDREIARRVDVSPQTVSNIRKALP